jgi:hypothetical protein
LVEIQTETELVVLVVEEELLTTSQRLVEGTLVVEELLKIITVVVEVHTSTLA